MYNFALKHSGLTTVHHSYNTFWTFVVYGIIIVGALLTLAMIIWFTGTDEWDLAATTTNFTQAGWSNKVATLVICDKSRLSESQVQDFIHIISAGILTNQKSRLCGVNVQVY